MATVQRSHFISTLPLGRPSRPAHASNAPRLSRLAWVGFFFQLLAIAALELSDDLFRGSVAAPNGREALRHARELVRFEQIHGFFVEPAIQVWLRHSDALFGLLSYSNVERV